MKIFGKMPKTMLEEKPVMLALRNTHDFRWRSEFFKEVYNYRALWEARLKGLLACVYEFVLFQNDMLLWPPAGETREAQGC